MSSLTAPQQPNRTVPARSARSRVSLKTISPEIPRLENGDRLSVAEYWRRYEATPEDFKAELIEGVVYVMASPVSTMRHGIPQGFVITWLGTYCYETDGVTCADNSTVRLGGKSVPQPDALLMVDPSAGGQATIDEKGYVAGAPELVLEVTASTASYDLHDKLAAYCRHGIKEYITWRVDDGEIDWRVLRDGKYVLLQPDEKGLLRSEVFPGLVLDAAALIKGDMKRVARAQRAALKSPEYKQFAAKLAAALKKKP